MTINDIITAALAEDICTGDITTELIEIDTNATATIVCKQPGVVCGVHIAKQVFEKVDVSLKVEKCVSDGDSVGDGEILLNISGSAASILAAERTALNFLGHLSGIATRTAAFVQQVQHVQIYDTRKTTPLLREMEKYAVHTGGGHNHRFGLSDQILIKENHITAAGGVTQALQATEGHKREIEVTNVDELHEALSESAEVVLLDNMSPDEIRKCLTVIDTADVRPIVEVSGGITLANVSEYDIEGVDRASIGSLTYGAGRMDVSLIFATPELLHRE